MGYRPFVNQGPKIESLQACCYGNRIFFSNVNGPSNHHTKFEAFLIYNQFYKNPKSKRFPHRISWWLAEHNHNTKSREKSLTFKLFITSIINWYIIKKKKQKKLGRVIVWTISIVKKILLPCNMPGRIQFLAHISQLAYIFQHASKDKLQNSKIANLIFVYALSLPLSWHVHIMYTNFITYTLPVRQR